MKSYILELQAIEKDEEPIDASKATSHKCCPHLERWLPRVLDLTTSPTEDMKKYQIANPVHALHLETEQYDTEYPFGEEQKRSEALWKTSGIAESFVQSRSVGVYPSFRKRIRLNSETKTSGIETKHPAHVLSSSNVMSASGKSGQDAMAQVKPMTTVSASVPSTASVPRSSGAPSNIPIPISTTSSVTSTLATSPPVAAPKPQTVTSQPPVVSSSVELSTDLVKTEPTEDDRLQRLRRLENQILLQRRNLFAKRRKITASKKNKSVKEVKKTPKLIPDADGFVEAIDARAWEREASRAQHIVNSWIERYRQSRLEYYQSRQTAASATAISKSFGAIPSAPSEGRAYKSCSQCTRKGKRYPSSDDIMQCLECDFVGCAPNSLASCRTSQHIIQHFLLKNHNFAVTCGERAEIYCFGCNDCVSHDVFEAERERLAVGKEWSWPSHPVQRSFDAFQFVSTSDHGIVWKGLVAEYPTLVPKQHREMAKLVQSRKVFFSTQQTPSLTGSSLLDMSGTRLTAPVGLYNMGNTCFMNGILQCLVHCELLQQHFLQEVGHDYRVCSLMRQTNREHPAYCAACELDKLMLRMLSSIKMENVLDHLDKTTTENGPLLRVPPDSAPDTSLYETKGTPLVPSDIMTAAWKSGGMDHLAGYDQRDAHEFLQAFLDILGKHERSYIGCIQKNLKNAYSDGQCPDSKADVVKRLFEGTLRSVSICQQCGEKRSLQEPFLNVSLPLSEDSMMKYSSQKINIQHCLKHFTAPERLTDPIECPSCETKTPTNKQQTFSKLPKILCLHLKRFDAAKNKKISDFVSFPGDGLDMGPLLPHWREVHAATGASNLDETNDLTSPEVLYDLFGTVNHRGTLNQGHYLSNVKIDGQWYHCNDSHVGKASEDDILKSEGAYLLFYMRRA